MVAPGVNGPRMGSSTSWPDDGFGSWLTGGPTISIEGSEHVRVDGDYYLLEIEGYLWEYKGSYWSKQSDQITSPAWATPPMPTPAHRSICMLWV